MLFKTKFHEGIRNGSITLTFRAWKSARAKVGKQYRFGPEEAVKVEAVNEVTISAIA
ncbi:ASCH domain-containing protein, partial [candidate division KSB1 bacterium]|nr:ASCH domain-containing protein [candidate division KSB1 bacterium]